MSAQKPTTRAEFKALILRRIGQGAIRINVTDDQVEDAVEYALGYYYDYHYNGSTIQILKQQVQSTDLTNGYFSVDSSVLGIRKVLSTSSSIFPSSGMFSPQYQIYWNNVNNLAAIDMTSYVIAQQQIELVNQILSTEVAFSFNAKTNKLIVIDNMERYPIGAWLLVEAYVKTDPDLYPEVWQDRWLQMYASEQVRMMWGNNLSKMTNVQILGGVTLNGDNIQDEARQAIQAMEDDMQSHYMVPPIDRIA